MRIEKSTTETPPKDARGHIARAFSLVEDVVYVGMGVLLAYSAGALLVIGAMDLWRASFAGTPLEGVIGLLDRTLLVLMLVELLYTVQVSFREHALLPEPFLIVGLIAATRRILVVTAAFAGSEGLTDFTFRVTMTELAILTVMIVAFVGSLLMLRRRHPDATATRT